MILPSFLKNILIFRKNQTTLTQVPRKRDWSSAKRNPKLCVSTLMHQGQSTSMKNHVLEHIEKFTCLGCVISTDNSAQKDIKARLNKARCAFSRLKNIWKSKQYSPETKVHIYNSNVKSVLLHDSKCWRMTFRNSCLCEGSEHPLARHNFQQRPVPEDWVLKYRSWNQETPTQMAGTCHTPECATILLSFE